MLSTGNRVSSFETAVAASAADTEADVPEALGFVTARTLSAWPTSVSATVPTRSVSGIVAGQPGGACEPQSAPPEQWGPREHRFVRRRQPLDHVALNLETCAGGLQSRVRRDAVLELANRSV